MPTLYHGPGARQAAVDEADRIGRLIAPPFGDDGLDVSTSREIVEALSRAPVSDQVGVVVVGPLDKVKSLNAPDALLKTFEDLDVPYLVILAWASEATEVRGTIVSRCHLVWCPGGFEVTPEAPYLKVAEKLCEAALRRRRAAVIETLAEHKGLEVEILRASAVVLSQAEWSIQARLVLWGSIREALRVRNPTHLETLSAYLV